MDKHKVREILERVDAALAQPPDAKPDCWAILTPNGSKLVSPQEAKGMVQAYPLYTAPPSAAALIAEKDAALAELRGYMIALFLL
jgi:hypothetical protein